MKNQLWLFQLPVVLFALWGFLATEWASQGRIAGNSSFVSGFRRLTAALTDAKYKIRGHGAPAHNIVIVEVDEAAIQDYGRWPWHRDLTATLIENSFRAGARAIGLDMVFSEEDKRIPEKLEKFLQSKNLGHVIPDYDSDGQLEATIARYKDRLVVGWAGESICNPAFEAPEACPVSNPDFIGSLPKEASRFSLPSFKGSEGFRREKTPIASVIAALSNHPRFALAAGHAGYFNAFPDADGIIRHTPLLMFMDGRLYPSLATELARVILNDTIEVAVDPESGSLTDLRLVRTDQLLPISRLGVIEANFRGPARTYTYVSAWDMLSPEDTLQDPISHKLTGKRKTDVFKDASVLIGVSALGAFDMRAFPYDSNVPGVEGHATILDNILAGDYLIPSFHGTGIKRGDTWLILLMTAGALVFAYLMQRLESVPALILFVAVTLGAGTADLALFKHRYNWNTSFLYLEIGLIFLFTWVAKYIIEERNKKFIRSAFSKYVAPAIVDEILKDPAKLSLGGEKRELTILFSDIRGFTTFSEQMDAKILSAFLNDYFGIMTKIIFETGGTLDKYIGDAVMAFWGAPLDQDKHAFKATQAAAAMIQALRNHRDRFQSQYGIQVDIGIGINTGFVSVGNMGSEDNLSYTTIGDHVNLASRLEGLTKAYGVAVVTTRFTADHIIQHGDPLFHGRVLDQVKVKGKKTAVELLEVTDQALPAEGLRLFEEARALYAKRQWDAAIEKFKAASAVLSQPGKQDGPCGVYIERCEHFKVAPPAEDWAGSWEMRSK